MALLLSASFSQPPNCEARNSRYVLADAPDGTIQRHDVAAIWITSICTACIADLRTFLHQAVISLKAHV